jgi:hypothetical protein
MSFSISFDSETGKYEARQTSKENSPIGEGDTCYAALDNLEEKLAKRKN